MAVVHCLAQQRDVEIHLMATTPSCSARHSRRCKTFHLWNGDDAERVKALVDVVDRIGVAVAVPILEPAIAFCARNRERLSGVVTLPELPSPVDLVEAGDKGRLAHVMQRAGIPHPQTSSANEEMASDFPFPLLLKPRIGSGGHGIELIRNARELRDVLGRVNNRLDSYIVQEFVPGHDLGCSVLCRDGVILAHAVQRSNWRSRRSFAPCSSIEFIDHPVALDIAARLVAALGWNGVANIDMREDAAGNVYVLEVNPRYWSTVLGSLYAGVNFPYLQCLAAVGYGFDVPKPATVRFACAHLSRRRSSMGRLARSGSVWRYTAFDPLPEISRQLRRIRQSG